MTTARRYQPLECGNSLPGLMRSSAKKIEVLSTISAAGTICWKIWANIGVDCCHSSGSQGSSRGRDRKSPHVVLLDQAGDEAGRLRLLDEVAQKGSARTVATLGANRLLHGRKLAIENARAGQRFNVGQETGP